MKNLLVYLVFSFSVLLTGCATVPMESGEKTAIAQRIDIPSEGMSGVYIYRDSNFGAALKKKIYIDDKLIGESAPKVFFYKQLNAGLHKFSTESEFGNNDLYLTMDSGKNYFIRQYIKMGVLVGGANLEQVSEDQGIKAVRQLRMAVSQ